MSYRKTSLHSVILALIFTSALVTGSCASVSRPDSPAEVERVVAALAAAINSADIDRFMVLFDPDATAFLPTAATPARLTGAAQIRAVVSPVLETRPTNPMAVRELLITVEGAMAIASFEIGNPIVHSRRTLVLMNRGGNWKIVHLHASNLRAESN
ncbi:MAG: nuclear transport factor 2 family protein [Acidobacteria bacterium]|nr:nuclear transport factor 2 family protein [Acidobacteriota bacterium]